MHILLGKMLSEQSGLTLPFADPSANACNVHCAKTAMAAFPGELIQNGIVTCELVTCIRVMQSTMANNNNRDLDNGS